MHFIAFELGGSLSVMAWRGCFLAIPGHWALITLLWVVTVVYVTTEVTVAVIPLASTDEDTAVEPFRAVVARGSTVIRTVVIVTVGT